MSNRTQQAKALQRDFHPHKAAVAAMWLYGSSYAQQRLGSMGFWDSLSASEQRICRDMVTKIEAAPGE